MDKIIHKRILDLILTKNWIHEAQHGFMPHHGTSTQLARVAAMIKIKQDESEKFFAIFVDVKKAFDAVPRDILYEECHELGGAY